MRSGRCARRAWMDFGLLLKLLETKPRLLHALVQDGGKKRSHFTLDAHQRGHHRGGRLGEPTAAAQQLLDELHELRPRTPAAAARPVQPVAQYAAVVAAQGFGVDRRSSGDGAAQPRRCGLGTRRCATTSKIGNDLFRKKRKFRAFPTGRYEFGIRYA